MGHIKVAVNVHVFPENVVAASKQRVQFFRAHRASTTHKESYYSIKMNPRGVLFDFDFTLADPTGWLIPAWERGLKSIGESPPAADALLKMVGRPLGAQYSWVTGREAEGSKFENFKTHYISYRDANATAGTKIFPGVEETLRALSARGLPLAIVSTGAARRLQDILASGHLLRFFSIIEAGCENKAEGIRRSASLLSIPRSQTVYVGDHPDDGQAAALAGTPFVAVLTGVHGGADFAPGTIVVSSVTSLVGLFGMLFGAHQK